MKRAFLVGCSVLFCFSAPAATVAPTECLSNFLHSRSRLLKVKHLGKRWVIGGTPAERFLPPPSHHPGTNDGMFRIQRAGKSHLIKILFVGIDPKIASSEKQVRSMHLAEQAGGPHIYSEGRIEMPDGKRGYYIEMEEKFPGQETFTFKGTRADTRGEYDYFLTGTPTLSAQVAAKFVKAYEHRLSPDSDIDFIFSNGKAEWIDVSGWTENPDIDAHLVRGLKSFLRKIANVDESVAAVIEKDFTEALTRSSRFSEPEKTRLLELVRE